MIERKKYVRWSDVPILMTLDEAALLLDISRPTAKRLAQAGKIPAFKASAHSWRVDKDKLLEWMENGGVQD